MSLAHVRETYPDAPWLPPLTVHAAEPARLLWIAAEYRDGRLFQLRISTSEVSWSMADEGVLMPAHFALAAGFEDAALHALDVVQGFTRTTWERPWQPGTAALGDAMLAVPPAERVGLAAERGLPQGIPSEDLRMLGLLPERSASA